MLYRFTLAPMAMDYLLLHSVILILNFHTLSTNEYFMQMTISAVLKYAPPSAGIYHARNNIGFSPMHDATLVRAIADLEEGVSVWYHKNGGGHFFIDFSM